MAPRNLAERIAWLGEQAVRYARRLKDKTFIWFGMIAQAVRETLKPGSVITAAAIAYFAILSLFPLTLLSISIASFSMGPSIDQQLIIQKLEFIAPALGQLLGQNFGEILLARGPVTLLALAGLLWSASTFFYMLNGTLNTIWGTGPGRPFWKRRGLAILFVLSFVSPILFLASFTSSITANLQAWLPEGIIPAVSAIGLLVAILLDVSLFFVLYILLPHGSSTLGELLPGAIGAGLLWELAKKLFISSISTFLLVSNLVYGSVAAIIAFLLWAYLSGLIFLFGVFLSVAVNQRNTVPGQGRTKGPVPKE